MIGEWGLINYSGIAGIVRAGSANRQSPNNFAIGNLQLSINLQSPINESSMQLSLTLSFL